METNFDKLLQGKMQKKKKCGDLNKLKTEGVVANW